MELYKILPLIIGKDQCIVSFFEIVRNNVFCLNLEVDTANLKKEFESKNYYIHNGFWILCSKVKYASEIEACRY